MRTLCIMALLIGSAFAQNPEDALLKTPAVTAAITFLHEHTHQGFNGDKTEWSFVIGADGKPSTPQSSHEYSSNHLTVFIGADRAIIHSHPDGTAAQPSNGDMATAKHCAIPNFEVSGYAIWVAEADGTTVRKVADITQGKHGIIVITYL
jgi:hypothetical protein